MGARMDGGWRMRRYGVAALSAAVLLIAACGDKKTVITKPPRATDSAPLPSETSVIGVPVDADIGVLRRAVEQSIPRRLWSINQHLSDCVPPQRVKVLGARVKVTPSIACNVIGHVDRGSVRLRGDGRTIIVDVPINAKVSARDVGGVLHGETATGSAMAHAVITLDLRPDWTTRAQVRLRYAWTRPPGIDFLGRRITFTDEADSRLQPMVPRLEQAITRELSGLNLRHDVEQVWRGGFTSFLLNEHDPPVWLRVTPRKLSFGGYSVQGSRLRLNLGVEALTETFVGDRPADSAVTPLPALARDATAQRLNFFLPVVADYAQLEPVLLRALVRRSARPFDLPGVGPVNAQFSRVELYGATEGRIAAGITLSARRPSDTEDTHGTVWLTAVPVNSPGSTQVRFTRLETTGDTDGIAGDLLLRLASYPALAEMIAAELTQNFDRDVADLQGKIRRAVDNRRQGDFLISTAVTGFETGQIRAYGNGLYLPVRAHGTARLRYRPQ